MTQGLPKTNIIEETHYFRRTADAGRPPVLRVVVVLRASMTDCAIGGYYALLKMFV